MRAHRAARLADAEDAPLLRLQQVAVVARAATCRRGRSCSTSAAAAAATVRAFAIRRSRAIVSALAVPVSAGRRHVATATSTVRASRRSSGTGSSGAPAPSRPPGRAAGRSARPHPRQVSMSPCSDAVRQLRRGSRALVPVGEQRPAHVGDEQAGAADRDRLHRPRRRRRRPPRAAARRTAPGATAVPASRRSVVRPQVRPGCGRSAGRCLRCPRPRARADRARPRRWPA